MAYQIKRIIEKDSRWVPGPLLAELNVFSQARKLAVSLARQEKIGTVLYDTYAGTWDWIIDNGQYEEVR